MTPVRDPAKFPTLNFEQALWKAGFKHVAGIDEAGRGAWAGPVCAAAVILPPDPELPHRLERVRDSKLMTPLARETWAPRIKEAALAWGVGFASSQEIDMLGILPATKLAATRALEKLDDGPRSMDHPLIPDHPIADHLLPDYLLTDFLLFPYIELPQTALVKGDRLSLSVAAASVLAKTARDALMRELDCKYPGYGFARSKGYGTQFHQEAIRRLGLCEIHRRSFSINVTEFLLNSSLS
jgi:ribonuclease HII